MSYTVVDTYARASSLCLQYVRDLINKKVRPIIYAVAALMSVYTRLPLLSKNTFHYIVIVFYYIQIIGFLVQVNKKIVFKKNLYLFYLNTYTRVKCPSDWVDYY